MPAISWFQTETLLSQFDKRDYEEYRVESGSDTRSPVAIVGLVLSAFTLAIGIVSLRRTRFRSWVSSSLPQRFKKSLGSTLPNPAPGTTTTKEGLSAIQVEIHISGPIIICSHLSNAHIFGAQSNILGCGHNGIAGRDSGVPQAEEPVVAKQFP
ncbi:hypothetical protein C7212DRAFT_342373 [Tuber magnatum]|uniref:Uncharacterized protein n=1 Tax=Tuber magnatum TaxID=42249 RepID=A0A317STV8_9PEZI|nr:hypothetical protein C7212DRAFT_342373 [Tuber magnatum]